MKSTAKAAAHPNIAFIKYWGNQNHDLRIPSNGSLSMNLEGLETQTTVSFDTALDQDQLFINTEPADEGALDRVSSLLDRIRDMAQIDQVSTISGCSFLSIPIIEMLTSSLALRCSRLRFSSVRPNCQ